MDSPLSNSNTTRRCSTMHFQKPIVTRVTLLEGIWKLGSTRLKPRTHQQSDEASKKSQDLFMAASLY